MAFYNQGHRLPQYCGQAASDGLKAFVWSGWRIPWPHPRMGMQLVRLEFKDGLVSNANT